MSTTLSTQAMVAALQRRLPLGFTTTFAMDVLNEAFRWVNQQGHFVWQLRRANPGVVVASTGYFPLPQDCDPGKPFYLGGKAGIYNLEIPYLPYEQALKEQHYGTNITQGMYSAWTLETAFTPAPSITYYYRGLVFPPEARPVGAGTDTLPFIYHALPGAQLSIGASIYFPTPDTFDSMLVELAEAKITRFYRLSGWEAVLRDVQSSFVPMLDAYRSTKLSVQSMMDQERLAKESQLTKVR